MPSKHSKSYLQPFSVRAPLYSTLDCLSLPVGGDLDLQLRRLLLAVDDRSFGIGGLEILSGLRL